MSDSTDDKIPLPEEIGDPHEKSKQVFKEYITRIESGEGVDPDEYLQKYPELKEDLVKLFSSIEDSSSAGHPEKEGGISDENMAGRLPQLLGDFKILSLIGSGGMATVYEARQISLNRKVALKLLPPHLTFSDKAIKKFRREAEAGGRQSHPGIVAIYAVGQHEGTHYIAQELVEGGYNLADRLTELQGLPELPKGYFREVAKLVVETADALEHAHASGVIHRDVKPSNILLCPGLVPKVTDFGLARVEDALALSRTGDFAGTPYYMSPEQAMSRRIGIDKRTDIYSLGVTLYENLTLKRPFDGNTSHEILKRIVLHEPEDPRRLNPRVPRDLSVICLKAMEKDPQHRYSSMADFADDLRRYLQGEVILAKPAGFVQKQWKQVKRNKVVSTAIGVAALALVALIVSIPLYYIQIKEVERKAAIQAKEQLEKELEITVTTLTFIMKIFTYPVHGCVGKEVKVIDLLDHAANNIDIDFASNPQVAQLLHYKLGTTYKGLSIYNKAALEFERAREMRQQMYGDHHKATVEATAELANIYMDQGRFVEAEPLILQVMVDLKNIWGEFHPETLKSMKDYARVLENRGKLADAEKILNKVYEQDQKNLEVDELDRNITKNRLAILYWRQKKYDKAEALFRELKGSYEQIYGKNHDETHLCMGNLAMVLATKGELAKAESLFLELLGLQKQNHEEEHPAILQTMENLGGVLKNQDKYSEAEEIYQKVIRIRLRTLGEEDVKTQKAIMLLVEVYKRWDKPDSLQEFFDTLPPPSGGDENQDNKN